MDETGINPVPGDDSAERVSSAASIEPEIPGPGEANRSEKYFGLKDVESFKASFIGENRGKPLFLIRFARIQGMDLLDFVQHVRHEVRSILDIKEVEFGFHYVDTIQVLLMGISPIDEWGELPNIDNAVGRFHEECLREARCKFDFGISRTQCNYISSRDEIYNELYNSSEKNLNDNLVRWSWTYFNKANSYFSGTTQDDVIQPTRFFDESSRTFNVKGGEVFVGGGLYAGYHDLIRDIPVEQDLNRIELLILEKLLISCAGAPGLLKFNISPQTLIDTFARHERVTRMSRLLHQKGLNPHNIRFELVEKPYEEGERYLKDVCMDFFNYGITFAADDFGVKSQSHQVVLDLGQMIKEFKLDPISFKFKHDEDKTKFLDNLAFIAYCKRLADNREAVITAEAVEDYDTLRFLMEHRIYQFQANIFCGKMPIDEYKASFQDMKGLPEDVAMKVLTDPALFEQQKSMQNIFRFARYLQLY